MSVTPLFLACSSAPSFIAWKNGSDSAPMTNAIVYLFAACAGTVRPAAVNASAIPTAAAFTAFWRSVAIECVLSRHLVVLG